MSRKNVDARIKAALDEMAPEAKTSLAELLESFLSSTAAGGLGDLESDVQTTRRSRKAKAETADDDAEDDEDDLGDLDDEDESDEDESDEDEDKDEDEDEDEDEDDEDAKPTARKRRGKVVTIDPTYDGLFAFIDTLEVTPVAGGIRALKPLVESYGGDVAAITADAKTTADKAEELGTFLATMEALTKALSGCSEDDINALAEELGAEEGRSKKATIKSILVAFNSDDDDAEDDEDEDDEDEDADESDEDEDGEDEDEDEDDEPEAKPATRRRRK